MPRPRLPCPVPDPARAPFRVLAKAGEAAGLLGAGRADCPYGDEDERSAPWLDGWWQGRRTRERAARRPKASDPAGAAPRPARCRLPGCEEPVAWDPARTVRQNRLVDYCCRRHKERAFYRLRVARARAAAEAARAERCGRTMATRRKEPQPRPAVVGRCRVCGAPVAWDPAKSVTQNHQSHYCGEEHRLEWRRRVRAERAERERAEIAAGTRKRRPGGPGGKSIPDGCEAEAARLNAYWSALGYDIAAEVVVDKPAVEPGGRKRTARRIVSRLVGGVPEGASWSEVRQRIMALEKRQAPEERG